MNFHLKDDLGVDVIAEMMQGGALTLKFLGA